MDFLEGAALVQVNRPPADALGARVCATARMRRAVVGNACQFEGPHRRRKNK
jgi:hypothetical protein